MASIFFSRAHFFLTPFFRFPPPWRRRRSSTREPWWLRHVGGWKKWRPLSRGTRRLQRCATSSLHLCLACFRLLAYRRQTTAGEIWRLLGIFLLLKWMCSRTLYAQVEEFHASVLMCTIHPPSSYTMLMRACRHGQVAVVEHLIPFSDVAHRSRGPVKRPGVSVKL